MADGALAIETLSEHASFGGVQGFYRHAAREIGLPMKSRFPVRTVIADARGQPPGMGPAFVRTPSM